MKRVFLPYLSGGYIGDLILNKMVVAISNIEEKFSANLRMAETCK
jgi:hypothetical protein